MSKLTLQQMLKQAEQALEDTECQFAYLMNYKDKDARFMLNGYYNLRSRAEGLRKEAENERITT